MSNLLNGMHFRLLSLEDFENRGFATRILQTLLHGPQFLVPKLFGSSEPLKAIIDRNNVASLVDFWVPAQRRIDPAKPKGGLLLMEFTSKGQLSAVAEKGPLRVENGPF